jgi:hypothetical protein
MIHPVLFTQEQIPIDARLIEQVKRERVVAS